jgi:hypothetical protein
MPAYDNTPHSPKRNLEKKLKPGLLQKKFKPRKKIIFWLIRYLGV